MHYETVLVVSPRTGRDRDAEPAGGVQRLQQRDAGGVRSALAELARTSRVDVVVLTAAGERAFSTGLDVTERRRHRQPVVGPEAPVGRERGSWPGSESQAQRVLEAGDRGGEGHVRGRGFYWIADCDIVLCSPEATFFDPHVTYGLVAALEPIALCFRMHLSDVMRMALLGLHERMTADARPTAGWSPSVSAQTGGRTGPGTRGRSPRSRRRPCRGRSRPSGGRWTWTRPRPATALLYTQVGNPIGTADLDRGSVARRRRGGGDHGQLGNRHDGRHHNGSSPRARGVPARSPGQPPSDAEAPLGRSTTTRRPCGRTSLLSGRCAAASMGADAWPYTWTRWTRPGTSRRLPPARLPVSTR